MKQSINRLLNMVVGSVLLLASIVIFALYCRAHISPPIVSIEYENLTWFRLSFFSALSGLASLLTGAFTAACDRYAKKWNSRDEISGPFNAIGNAAKANAFVLLSTLLPLAAIALLVFGEMNGTIFFTFIVLHVVCQGFYFLRLRLLCRKQQKTAPVINTITSEGTLHLQEQQNNVENTAA